MLNSVDNKIKDRDIEEEILRKLDLETNYLMNDGKWMCQINIKRQKIVKIDINKYLNKE